MELPKKIEIIADNESCNENILVEDGETVVFCYLIKIQEEEMEVAREMCKRYNQHKELLGVLKEMESNLYSCFRKEIADRAKAVIAKAEGNHGT